MIIDCISDLHGYYPKLEGGDLLIVAGDLTATDIGYEYNKFAQWIMDQQYRKKIVIAGNHDNFIQELDSSEPICKHFIYLCDSETEFEGLNIWGSPLKLKQPKRKNMRKIDDAIWILSIKENTGLR